MKRLFIATTVYLFSTTLSAQIKIPAELQSHIAGKNKLYEIMQIVDSFYQTKADTDNQSMREWKHWSRWALEMGRYVNPDGKLVNTRKIYSDALLEKQQQRLTELNESTGEWSFLGPDAFTHVRGLYRGLGRVDAIAFHPTNSNIMYAGTPNGGIFKTTDGGNTWNNLPNYGPYLGVSDIVVDHSNPSVIYALTGDGDSDYYNYLVSLFGYRGNCNGVMKSVDGGSTWQLLNNGFPTGDTIWSGFTLAQNPVDANILLAATRAGVYYTANGGGTWTKVLDSFCTDIKFRPGSSNCYAAGKGWCNFSTNGGLTWTASLFAANQSPSGANRSQLAVTPANTNYVYMLCGPADPGDFKGVWLSTNGGQSFSLRANTPNILGSSTNGGDGDDQSGYDLALAVSSTNANTVYTGGLCVWKSTNSGSNLIYNTTYAENETQMQRYIHPDVHDLQVNPLNGHLWAATDGGLYRTTDGGSNWTDFSEGISTAQPYHLAGFESLPNLLMFGCQDNGVKNRIGNTTNWRHIAGADGFDVVFDFNNSARAWVTINRGINYTPNYGDTLWSIDNNCGSCDSYFFPNIAQHVTNPNTLFIGSKDVYRTTDNGATYSTFTTPTGRWDIVTCPSNSNRIYCAGGDSLSHVSPDGRMFRSDDGGDNWAEISTGTNFPPTAQRTKITSIGVNPSNSLFVWATFGGTIASTKVFFSANGGSSWSNISSGLPNVPVNCITVTANNDVYIGTELGVYYRPTGGVWTAFYNNLPNAPVTDLVINQTAGKIRAATFGRGIWESPLFTNCIPVVSVTGTQNGRKLYEASTQVNSTAIVTGGAGTEVFFKGGNNVTLTPGFEARTGSEFKAYINGCGLGGIPDMNGRLTSGIDYTTHRLPMGDSSKYPYGTIELNPAGSEATYRIYKPGAYTLQVTDSKGYIIQTLAEKQLPTGTHHFSFTKPAATEMLYLQLWYNKELVHYQEIN